MTESIEQQLRATTAQERFDSIPDRAPANERSSSRRLAGSVICLTASGAAEMLSLCFPAHPWVVFSAGSILIGTVLAQPKSDRLWATVSWLLSFATFWACSRLLGTGH